MNPAKPCTRHRNSIFQKFAKLSENRPWGKNGARFPPGTLHFLCLPGAFGPQTATDRRRERPRASAPKKTTPRILTRPATTEPRSPTPAKTDRQTEANYLWCLAHESSESLVDCTGRKSPKLALVRAGNKRARRPRAFMWLSAAAD